MEAASEGGVVDKHGNHLLHKGGLSRALAEKTILREKVVSVES